MLSIPKKIRLSRTYTVCIRKVLELAGGGSATNRATPSSFDTLNCHHTLSTDRWGMLPSRRVSSSPSTHSAGGWQARRGGQKSNYPTIKNLNV